MDHMKLKIVKRLTGRFAIQSIEDQNWKKMKQKFKIRLYS